MDDKEIGQPLLRRIFLNSDFSHRIIQPNGIESSPFFLNSARLGPFEMAPSPEFTPQNHLSR